MKLLVLFFWLPIFGYSLSLKSLKDSSYVNISNESMKQGEVFILFQPQCSSCFQQFKQLSCLEGQAQIRAVGAFASEKTLQSEYLKKYSKYVGLKASEDFLKKYLFENQRSKKEPSKRALDLVDLFLIANALIAYFA